MAAATVALIAGAPPEVAFRLGLGMLCLQFAIGAANDHADAAFDAVAKPKKPIPSGLVSRRAAALVSLTAAGLGLLTAATVGIGALIVGAMGLADGLVYDLRLKGTPLGWIPFAAGVGLLPLYAWWGAQGSFPVALLGVAALAVSAGVTLALANAYADLEKDRLSHTASVATLLGARRTLLANSGLLAGVQLLVVVTTVVMARPTPLLFAEGAGCGLGWFGLGLAAVSGDRARQLGWEVQSLGILVLGAGWLAALSSAGILRS